ncbi:MAG: heavy metal translocating P-type ATPase [Elusimicrobiota bacterium]|jgi:Cu+-exporting ATPase|nr:heavy metal translocating P-type ATPase [Elusimicrobiota bacterium]
MDRQALNIAGMSQSGAQIIKKALKKLNGIKDISLNLISEKLFAVYDENIVSNEEIKTVISKAGFDAMESLAKDETAIIIGGITSQEGAQGLEKMIEKIDGIEKASVNFATGKAIIKYDNLKIRISTVKDRIMKAGYKVIEIFKKDFAYIDQFYKKKYFNAVLRDFIICFVLLLPLIYISFFAIFIYVEFPLSDMLSPIQYPLRYGLFQLMFVIAIVVVSYKIFFKAAQSIKKHSFNMEALAAASALVLIGYSIYGVIQIAYGYVSAVESLYFATAGFICAVILLGKLFEDSLKNKIMGTIRTQTALIPKTAVIIKNGFEDEITIDEVEIDDIIIVRPGEYIAADGIIIDGSSIIDESVLTGNQNPVAKQVGDKVFCASLNTQGTIHFKVIQTGNDASIFRIIKILEDFQETKSPISQVGEKAALYLAPIFAFLSVIAGAFWLIQTQDLTPAVISLAACLVIGSSNAFAYSAPAAFIMAAGVAAKNNILVRNANIFDISTKVDSIVFEKTGVIVSEKQEVTDIITADKISSKEFLQTIASAESSLKNIIASALIDKAKSQNIKIIPASDINISEGLGLKAKVEDIKVLIGNEKYMQDNNISIENFAQDADKLQAEAKTVIFAAFDGKIAGLAAISNNVRLADKEAINIFNKLGIETVMITADSKKTSVALGKQLNIKRINSQALPQDRISIIKRLQNEDKTVAVLGNSLSDLVLLNQADIGIAFNTGATVDIKEADIIIMRQDIMDAVFALNLSKQTIKNIKRNAILAFVYSGIGLVISAGVFALIGLPLLNPAIAATFAAAIPILALINALKLQKFKI